MQEVKVEIDLCKYIHACFEMGLNPLIPMVLARKLGVTDEKWKEAVSVTLRDVAEDAPPEMKADVEALLNRDNDPKAAHEALHRIMASDCASHGTPLKGVH